MSQPQEPYPQEDLAKTIRKVGVFFVVMISLMLIAKFVFGL